MPPHVPQGWSLTQQGVDVAWELVEKNAALLSEVLMEKSWVDLGIFILNKSLQMAQMEVS